MRRLFYLLPLLAAAACPGGQKVHLFADLPPQGNAVRCAAAQMASLGYTVQDSVRSEIIRRVAATRREGNLETTLTARVFAFQETGVRRLSVRADVVNTDAQAQGPPPAPSRRTRADAEAILRACGTPDADIAAD